MRQKTELEITLHAGTTGEAPSADAEGTEARAAKTELESRAAVGPSMEAIVERVNLKKALARVKRNKGASGLDGMTIDELVPYLKEHWPRIRAQLLDGIYKPQPVRRVEIPKASGGKRPLGIPTVLDPSSSRRSCRCCKRTGTGRSPRTATASGRRALRIRRWRG